MALNNFKCNYLMPLPFKGLRQSVYRPQRSHRWQYRRADTHRPL